MNKEALQSLDSYTGTENYHRCLLAPLLLSDGAKALADAAEAYWLMDIIASYQSLCKKDAALQGIQFWRLIPATPESIKCPGRGIKTQGGIQKYSFCQGSPVAYVVCERDTDDAAIVQELDGTSFPFDVLPRVDLYVAPTEVSGRKYMLAYLPSEN